MTDRLFISHASEDEAVVDRIVAYLEAHGVPCWVAGRDIPPKAIYAEEITKGIQDCGACGVIVSRAANASAAIKRELELASHYGKAFIPIRIDATEPGPGLDYYLRNTQWINYGRDGNKALDRIAAHMAGGVQTPTRHPEPAPAPKANLLPLLAVGGALLLAAIGWLGFSALQNHPAATAEITATDTATTTATTTAPAAAAPEESQAQRAERERLQRERDDALTAARTAEEGLAQERRREAAQQQQQQAPPPTLSLAGSTWWGSYTGQDGQVATTGWRLNADGSACWGSARGDFSQCGYYSWSLNGDHLILRNSGGTNNWEGTVSGSTYSGTIGGGAYTFLIYRN